MKLPALALLLLAAPQLAFADEPQPHRYFGATPNWEKTKSPTIALALSAGMTASGIALVALDSDDFTSATGIVLALAGPYAGYAYTGDLSRALRIGLAQGVAVGAIALGASLSIGDSIADSGDNPEAGGLLILAGLVAFAGTSVFAITDSYNSAKRVNAGKRQLRLGPSAVVGPARTTGAGLALSGAF